MELLTWHWASVWNASCDSRSFLRARTREELWTMIEDGQRRRIYSSVYETGTELAPDPLAYEAEVREFDRKRMTSCPMPPEEDLLLLRDAKRVDPADREAVLAIKPSRGSWKRTRQLLQIIRNEKYNEHIRLFWAAQHTP